MNDQQLRKAIKEAASDTIIVGHGLMLRRQGAEWTWSVRYRANGVRRRVTLGKYPRLSLSKARTAASKVLRQVDLGEDPQAAQKAARAASERAKRDSIEALCQRYLARAQSRKRSWTYDRKIIRHVVLPAWKGRAVTSITRRDCKALVQSLADRGAPMYGNRVATFLSTLFAFAMDIEEIIASNPASRLPRPGLTPEQRPEGAPIKAYDHDELRLIWSRTELLAPGERAIYRLQILTGQRPSEVRDLSWDEIDGPWWTIPAERSKNKRAHRVFLTREALEVLADVPCIADERYAFVGVRHRQRMTELNRQIFEGIRPRPKARHAIRDTVASGLAAAGVSIEDIAKVLGHTYGPRVTASYNQYAYDREKRLAVTRWARRLRQILDATDDNKLLAFRG